MILLPIDEALPIANKYVNLLQPHCERIEIVGSLRRKATLVETIEVLCIPRIETQGLFVNPQPCVQFREALGWIGTRVEGTSLDHYIKCRLKEGMMFELHTTRPESYGLHLAFFTGSPKFTNEILDRGLAKQGYTIKNGTLYDKTHKATPVKEEADLFALIGYDVIPPQERNLE